MTTTPPTESNNPHAEQETSSDSVSIAPGFATRSVDRDLREVLGIDFLVISFPIAPPARDVFDQCRHDEIRGGHVRRTGTIGFEVEGMETRCSIWPDRDGWRCSLKVNPARHVSNSVPWRGLLVHDLPGPLRVAWCHLHHFVTPLLMLNEAALRRIDIARDFTAQPTQRLALLTGLHRVKVPYATRRPMYTDRQGVPRSLYAGTKGEGSVRAYDHQNYHGTSPPHTLRVEAQAHSRWAARYGGMETVGDISPSAVATLYTDRFAWAAMDTPVVFEHDRLQRLWSLTEDPAGGITPLQAIRLVGVERLREAGIAVPEGNSTASTRKAATGLLGAPHRSETAPPYIRLHPAHDEPLRLAS